MAATNDRPYDPYIPSEPAAGGAAGGQSAPGNQRTAALQAVSSPITLLYVPVYILSSGRICHGWMMVEDQSRP